jgi:hypothetical protein
MQYSTDGINWTVGSMPANRSWWMPQWNGSIWVVNTYDSSNIATSPDGINWTNRTISGYTGGFDHAADPVSGIFAIPGYNQANGYTSTDGINWTTTAMPATSNYSCSAYGNGVYVAVSNGTTNAASATR